MIARRIVYGCVFAVILALSAPGLTCAATGGSIVWNFYGQIRFGNFLADEGVSVDVLVVRSATDYTVCGHGETMDSPTEGPGSYIVAIDRTKPACANPKAMYTFFVNSVNVGPTPNPFKNTGNENLILHSLAAPIVALHTPNLGDALRPDRTIPIVYFYGAVSTPHGPVPNGTVVKVVSADGACEATTTTSKMHWAPRADPFHPVEIPGYYQIGLLSHGACADRSVTWNFSVNGMAVSSKLWRTPLYAQGALHNFGVPKAPQP